MTSAADTSGRLAASGAVPLPRRADFPMHAGPTRVVQGIYQYGYDAGAYATVVGYNLSTALNDEFQWDAILEAGTYRLDVVTRPGADRAITTFDISFDGGNTWTPIGNRDMYTAATGIQGIAFPGIVVPRPGLVILRARATGRNAANTTGYIMGLSAMTLTRTGA